MWYKIKFKAKKTWTTNSRYNYRTFKKGKVYEIIRKTTPSIIKKCCKDYAEIISIKRLRR